VADCVPKPARRVAHGSSRVGRTSVPGDSAVIVINAHAARLDMLGLEETGSSDSMWSAKSRCCRSDLRTSTEGRNLSHSWSRWRFHEKVQQAFLENVSTVIDERDAGNIRRNAWLRSGTGRGRASTRAGSLVRVTYVVDGPRASPARPTQA